MMDLVINYDLISQALRTSPYRFHPRPVTGVSIDSRTIKPGELFFAIVGPTHDGHQFIQQALGKGASGIVADEGHYQGAMERYSRIPNLYLVPETTLALGELAREVRRRVKIPVIAVTGSAGKTTTKELLRSILGESHRVLANEGNYNNQYGLPLSLFKLTPSHELILAEMGASRKGDIHYLCELLLPQFGIITNVYPAHLEGFQDLECIYETKLDLVRSCAQRGGACVVFGDDSRLVEKANDLGSRLVTYGQKLGNDFRLEHVFSEGEGIRFSINAEGQNYTFHLKTRAFFHVFNALSAMAMARTLGISWEEIGVGLGCFSTLPGRFQVMDFPNRMTLIHDAYNANPASCRAALESFCWISGERRKVAVVGEMMELGKDSASYHFEMGTFARKIGVDAVIAIGKFAWEVVNGFSHGSHGKNMNKSIEDAYAIVDNSHALEFLLSFLKKEDVVLFKGSHGAQLDNLIETLKQRIGVSEKAVGIEHLANPDMDATSQDAERPIAPR